MPLTYTTITGTFKDGSQQPLNNVNVTFTPSATVYASGVPVVSAGAPVVAEVVGGQLKASNGTPLTLLATDSTGLTVGGRTGFWFWTVSITGQVTDGWSFYLPSSPSTVDLYATANSVSGGGGSALPLTTLGDTLYENATPAPARLPGNTSTVKNFLTQTGTGSVSAAPAWGTIAPADISAAFPWRFYVDNPAYGAKGDGKVIGDVVTNGTAVITSATANFTAADVGKYIMIHGAAGTTSGPLITTIASRQSATQVTLAASATATVSNCPAVYGTDDTAAINAAMTAAGAYATANSYFAEVVFGAKIYILGAGPTQTGNGTTTPTFNAQIPLPYPAANGTSQKLIIALTGPGDNGHCQYWESLVPNVAGAALVSMVSAPTTPSATFGIQSVIGGPSGAAGFTGGYANTKVVVRGLSVWCPIYTNLYAYDFGYTSAMRVQQSSAHIFAPTGVNGGVQPFLNAISATAFTSSIGSGFRTPVTNNNADSVMDDVTAEGYECGFRVFDHFNAGRLAAIYSDVAMFFNGTQGASGTSHGIFVQSIAAEVYNVGFLANGGTAQVDICWDAECTGVTYDINDASNALHGVFRLRDPADASRGITVNGAAKLQIINEELAPGHMATPPAVPAASTAAALVYRPAWVVVTGGTGVTISVDGTSTGLTSGAVRVPSGKSISLGAYTVAPTWQWWLD